MVEDLWSVFFPPKPLGNFLPFLYMTPWIHKLYKDSMTPWTVCKGSCVAQQKTIHFILYPLYHLGVQILMLVQLFDASSAREQTCCALSKDTIDLLSVCTTSANIGHLWAQMCRCDFFRVCYNAPCSCMSTSAKISCWLHMPSKKTW